MALSTTALQDGIATLRGKLTGRVIEPGDAEYEAARVVMYGGVAAAERLPAAVIRVANADDIGAVLAVARETGVELADRGAYVNFVGNEGEARVHDAYPGATYRRLAQIKRRYDPTNLFRLNQNIPPA